jgi:hypothetical protein
MAVGFPDDLRVVVLNKNDFNVSLTYDGQSYDYRAGKPVTVPPEVAWFHFAFDTRATPPFRNKMGGTDAHGVPWYENRLISYGWAEDDWDVPFVKKRREPWHTAEEKKAWFENFDFKVIGRNSVRNAKEFDALPAM